MYPCTFNVKGFDVFSLFWICYHYSLQTFQDVKDDENLKTPRHWPGAEVDCNAASEAFSHLQWQGRVLQGFFLNKESYKNLDIFEWLNKDGSLFVLGHGLM